MNSQQGLGSAGKDCSLRLTNPDSIPAASGFLLVGILSEGWPPHTDGKKSVRRPAQGYNTTIRAPIFFNQKKKKSMNKVASFCRTIRALRSIGTFGLLIYVVGLIMNGWRNCNRPHTWNLILTKSKSSYGWLMALVVFA